MDCISVEVWRPVVGWEAEYSVSNLGRIRSESRVATFVGDEKPCGFSGCPFPMRKKGWCDGHAHQFRSGKPMKPILKKIELCCFEGCGRIVERSTGLCVAHHGQLRKFGQLRPLGWVAGRIVNGAKLMNGYYVLHMYRDGAVQKSKYFHQLVMEAFVGPCPDGMMVRHLNDIKTDNRLANLAYGDASDNMQDRLRNGLHHFASRPSCKYGHDFTPENTVIRYRNGGQSRVCLTCQRDRSRGKKIE